ncbi:MAG TPA: hypothetical protein DCZ49_04195, partial [Hyphomonadaceae bacterium]|nr:hypothetical protein [Hyphomonadaceae bacterium]
MDDRLHVFALRVLGLEVRTLFGIGRIGVIANAPTLRRLSLGRLFRGLSGAVFNRVLLRVSARPQFRFRYALIDVVGGPCLRLWASSASGTIMHQHALFVNKVGLEV